MANYTISSYAATELGSDVTLNVTGASYNNDPTITHASITGVVVGMTVVCLLYTSPSPRDRG